MADETHVVDDTKLKLPDVQFSGKDTPTQNEEEEIIYKHRAKLYRLDEGEWKERCLGDVKLHKHKGSGRVRFSMFQEGNFRNRANFYVPVDCNMKAVESDPKMSMWSATDYSDEEPATWTFMLRVKTEEIAEEFRSAFKAASETNASVAPSVAATTESTSAATSTTATAVPQFSSLNDIYGDEATTAAARYDKIEAAYKNKYGEKPTKFVHAPGRVNLIGEHIDYHMYSVLPFALRQDVVIALGDSNDDEVQIDNLDQQFAAAAFPVDPSTTVDISAGVSWDKYVQAGYKGFFEYAHGDKSNAKGFRMMVHGTVPPAGGVSSSSALVVAALLATAAANGVEINKQTLGSAAWKAEAYVGTMGGGMDQAISAMAEEGNAARIDFVPELKSTTVPLPKNARFVVANSMVKSAKAADANERYNRRVTEGKLAAKLIAKKDNKPDWRDIATVRDLQQKLGAQKVTDLEPFLAHLKDEAYSVTDLENELGVAPLEAFSNDAQKDRVEAVLDSISKDEAVLFLKKRVRHIISEAQRVCDFERVARAGGETVLNELGELITSSHVSCRDDYECSVEELDELVRIAKESGAIAARLTGAGWGGCIVALVSEGNEQAVMDGLKERYYKPRGCEDTASVLFCSAPAQGAAVYEETEETLEL